ncbi:MAG TPA: SAM-dependent methyltransferase [Acidimicrobiales bacterium]|jgi:hypothetical protein|nr:SAM-dependent methyltransferase [Acidimicrobiales bacterium]
MTSTKKSYFDEIYRDDADPWQFETSPYEKRKYAITMASLPRLRYASAFEPGCSVGVLSEQLASRCDHVLATDFIAPALQRAQDRLKDLPHVTVQEGSIPDDWPAGPFDLVVLSEIGYYFDEVDLVRIVTLVLGSTLPGAHLVGVHWRGDTNYALSGDRVHEVITSCSGLSRCVQHEEDEFVLGVWERSH